MEEVVEVVMEVVGMAMEEVVMEVVGMEEEESEVAGSSLPRGALHTPSSNKLPYFIL